MAKYKINKKFNLRDRQLVGVTYNPVDVWHGLDLL